MEQQIVGGMIAVGITYIIASYFTYSMELEGKDKALELIENVGYATITVIICMTMVMIISLMVV